MTFYSVKFLSFFIYPLSVALVAGCVALALTFTRWSVAGQIILGISLVGLWVFSTPVVANWLNWHLESQFPPVAIEALPEKDVVVVLGGGSLSEPSPPRVTADIGSAVDRVIHAKRIYEAGKARVVLVSGGNLPGWETDVSEAELIADFLVELDIPRSAIVLETASRTTRENATKTAELFEKHEWKTAFLVTSGTHMPRALAVFQNAGLTLSPAATDIHAVDPRRAGLGGVLPDVGALAASSSAIKEIIGLHLYRLLGWA